MNINGSAPPNGDNRGRAFPYKESGPQYAGPCIVGGKLYAVKVWENLTVEGRKYLRFVFEEPEQNEG